MNNKILNYLTLIIILIAFPAFFIMYFINGGAVTVYTYTGLTLIIPSFILLVIARLQLGASFHVIAQANKLITTGLYNKFRHPIYYFSLLLILGVGIFLQQRTIFIFCLAVIFIQLKRIKNEEKVLQEKFGDEYIAYKKKTWF
jgi:protein-S-isoprenylcysteine O-methyltransferase Ste14